MVTSLQYLVCSLPFYLCTITYSIKAQNTNNVNALNVLFILQIGL
ncbi:hypothetical protein FPV14_01825 [Staphylococcus argenteus]|nr:hypothetical protein DVU64_08090 [Staphylococcus argenteus]MZG26042.1 hypothetical protein [Staphylococcus argenteus]QDZ03824.1 hypothetical protein FPV14_01825 [Staphylococcus argenteus]RRT87782.1 hypothetical protein DPF86_10055 [Staphylococcus argenteus]